MKGTCSWTIVALLGLYSAPVSAWHTGSSFADAPGAGGGGGIFYSGSNRDRGWTCAACHVNAPREVQIGLRGGGLFADETYEPDREYEIVVEILSETRGLGAGRSNFNSMVAMTTDEDARTVGAFAAEPDDFFARGRSIVASTGRTVGQRQWRMRWTAPSAGTGTIHFALAVVDGDGAGSAPDETRTDPFGDDLATTVIPLRERSREARWQRSLPVFVAGLADSLRRAPRGLPWTGWAAARRFAPSTRLHPEHRRGAECAKPVSVPPWTRGVSRLAPLSLSDGWINSCC